MKKLVSLFFSLIFFTTIVFGQTGFTIEYAGGGSLHTIDLTNATKTIVGTTLNSFGAGDFGANDVLYAINSGTNQFYSIDTTDGTTSLIGAITPPANHMWTGMAYDESTNTMYGYSAWSIAAGEGSLHIIDVTDGSYTLVGTQTTATAIGCIAIDGTGQMYGMNLQAAAKIYQIQKDNGTVTLIGDTGQGAAGMGHGMDWSNSEQTMYLTTYNSMTFENTLRSVDLTNGATTQIGGLLGMWTGVIAIPGSVALVADFSSDVNEVCTGGVVNYTDESTSATSWSWTFEGGTPSTSTDQNPTIIYNTVGVFDVTLEVSDGTSTSSSSVSDMITVQDIPGQPNQPNGETSVCGGEEYTYTTDAVASAVNYQWEVLPADAGTISGNGITAVFSSADNWNGDYTIKVNASNDCGSSAWSSELAATLNFTPVAYFVTGGGAYCEGGSGLEITLDGSEMNVDYELYHENVTTGIIVSGTGSPISFGFFTEEGLYTIDGYATSCSTLMFGEAYITVESMPGNGTQPIGMDEVCAGSTGDYQTSAIPDAIEIVWLLNPAEAGNIIGSGENIEIEWAASFSGNALLSVYGTNDCGDGVASDELEITVSEIPNPAILGETMVCKNDVHAYSTDENPGSTYYWVVEGGEIQSGSGTFEIVVSWPIVGEGRILVTETSSDDCIGISDTLIVFVDECPGITNNNIGEIKIYPNPARDYVMIDLDTEKQISYEVIIFNQFGQRVIKYFSIFGEKEINKINIETLKTGIYFINVITSSGTTLKQKLEVVN